MNYAQMALLAKIECERSHRPSASGGGMSAILKIFNKIYATRIVIIIVLDDTPGHFNLGSGCRYDIQGCA